MLWNQDNLRKLIEERLVDFQIILVSNREPYMHIYRGGEVKTIIPASGVAIALDSLMQSCGGTWVAAGSGEADRETVSRRGCSSGPSPGPQVHIAPGVADPPGRKRVLLRLCQFRPVAPVPRGLQPPAL